MKYIKDYQDFISEGVKQSDTPEWGVDEYVTWDEWQGFSNYGYDFIDKNSKIARLKKLPEECLCHLCSKELKKNYKTLRWREVNGQSAWFYNQNAEGKEVKIGNDCFKAMQAAHDKKYGKKP